jgi:hypothetical protein
MIYVCEHHDAVLRLWREQDLRGISLVHADFHDDLRGLMIDRRRGAAWPIGDLARRAASPDAGDFLAHAVLDGRIERIRWIHGPVGGRAWDMGIVRYADDFTAWPRRVFGPSDRDRARALEFRESPIDDWDGIRPGERLSVDWDCFASVLQDAAGIGDRVRGFLDRLGPTRPEDCYVALSPEYCRPSIDSFKELVAELGRRFEQTVLWVDPALERGELNPSDVDGRLPRSPVKRAILRLRRLGIY